MHIDLNKKMNGITVLTLNGNVYIPTNTYNISVIPPYQKPTTFIQAEIKEAQNTEGDYR